MGRSYPTIDLSIGSKGAKRGPLGIVEARKILTKEATLLGRATAQAQEFLSAEEEEGYSDALCADWSLFGRIYKQNPKLASALLVDRLQHLANGPEILAKKMLQAGVQMYTTKGDFPAEILDVIEKYHTGIEDVDTGWRSVFDVLDFKNTKKNGFKIRDVSSTLTFRKVPTGDKVDVYEMSGSDAEVPFDRYGGALGWDRTWFDDEDYWQATDTALEFRNKYFNDMADVHYGLVEALGAGINLAWQAPSPAALANTDAQYELSRDINTINEGCRLIIEALDDQGMSVTANTQLGILAPLALRARLNRALGATMGMASLRNPTQVEFAVDVPIYTTRLTSNTVWYLYLPGKKSKSGIRQDLTMFSDFDILAYADVTAGWGRYGAGIGEASQFKRCSIA